MTAPNRTDLPMLSGVDPRFLRKLDLSVLMLLLLVIVFRTMSAGQDPDSATTAFCEIITFLAASLWCLRKLAGKNFSLPSWKVIVPVGFFLAAIGVSAWRANPDGNIVQARLLAMHWAAEILLFFVILDYTVTRERFAVLVCGLLAAAAILIVYGIYQRAYGLPYFIEYVTAQPALAEKIAGSDPVFQGIFRGRLQSPQIYGPYGYANTMAGVLILGLPLLWAVAASAWIAKPAGAAGWLRRIVLSLLTLGGMVALAFTGSRGGMLAAKATEVIAFVLLAGNKNFRRQGIRAEILAAELLFSLAAILLALPLLLHAATAWLGQVLFGLLWSGVIVLVAGFCLRARRPPKATAIKALGALAAALLLAGIVWSALGAPGGPQSLQAKIAAQKVACEAGRNTPAVRWNYWRGGWKMWQRNFWLGVGLDQFSTHYTTCKPIQGWAVKRAHNNYLQMAADGGVLLLTAWLLLCVLFFLPRLRANPLQPETFPGETGGIKIPHRRLLIFGSITVFCALALMAFPDPFRIFNLRLPLFFEGLSIEFFINEYSGGTISQWPQNLVPGLIHLGTHVILLPLAGVGAFCLSWKIVSAQKNRRLIWQMLRLGILAMLLHALVDFVYYMQVISATAWVMAALALVQTTVGPQGGQARRKLAGKRFSAIAIPLAVVALSVLLWRWPLAHWERAQRMAAADYFYQYGESADDLDKAIGAYEGVLKQSPRDPRVHRRLSELYMRKLLKENAIPPDNNKTSAWWISPAGEGLREKAVRHARLTAKYHRGYAAAHAYLGQVLARLYPAADRSHLEEARAAFARAVQLNPYRPEYLYRLGELENLLGRKEAAKNLWRQALELDHNPLLSDARAHLDKKLRRELENRLGNLPGDGKINPEH